MAIPISNNPLGWEASEFAEIWWQTGTTVNEEAWINVKDQEPTFTAGGNRWLKLHVHGSGEGSVLHVDMMDNDFHLVMRSTYPVSDNPQIWSNPSLAAGRYIVYIHGVDESGTDVPGVEWMFNYISLED